MRILSAPAADFDITRPCRANQDGAVILWRRRFAYPAIPIPSDCMVSSKSPDKAKIIIGLSGGVDSAVAAALLIEQGRDVEALFMKNWEEDDTADYCAAEADLADAEQVAQRLGIPLHTVNFASEYWDRVFEHFLAQYQAGNTPNPDVLCNSEIKFKAFLDHARALGADRIATGHYAVTQRHDGLTQLRRAQDAEKDQTYFLHALTQAQLAPVDFPLGERRKPDVRKLARSLGLANHAKKDSTRPFFGVQPCLLDDQGKEIDGNPAAGNLAIKHPWPAQMRTVYGDHQRFYDTYFATYPGYYFTGDGARRDEDGYYWITGRVDDVLNVSGHRLGTAEIESALVLHEAVAEAAVVGYPHELTGQGIYAYVTLMAGAQAADDLKAELIKLVRSEIGPIAKINLIQWAPGLPKTRSGKIMRRILRKIAANELDNLGDTSTLADPSVVNHLIEHRANH